MATITFLFVDQVGSTEQLARLGDSGTVSVRDRLQEILRDAIAATGGVVVDHTGDGVMATFVGATEAVAAGVAMLQAAERASRANSDRALSLRVGVHTGEPQANQEGRYVGMAVVIAARLCSVAEPGQLLVSDLVRLLVGDAYATDDAGDRELKGVGPAVRTFAVRWEPARSVDQVPLPSRLGARPLTGVVGRALEREHLLGTLKAALTGDGHRVVLLSGEPGIGKTTLAADLAQRAPRGRGDRVVRTLRRGSGTALPAVR